MPTSQAQQPIPLHLPLAALIDPLVEAHGYPAHDDYVEACWLGALGPTATFAYRRLAPLISAKPDGITVDLDDLARSLGISTARTRRSVLTRTIDRLVLFDAAAWNGEILLVRRALAPLTLHHLRRASHSALSYHRWASAQR
jgi:hypothetical protein